MFKLLNNLLYLAILAGAAMLFWKILNSHREPLSAEQRAVQKDTQRRQAITLRLHELEQTHGAGRVRQNRDIENAARLLYNTRNHATLPLLK